MNNLKTLRLLAILEGISYLSFALTMPLKYMYQIPQPNYFVGMAHGVLFIAYIIYVFLVSKEQKWKTGTLGFGLIASLLPFATFVFDSKVVNPEIKRLGSQQ